MRDQDEVVLPGQKLVCCSPLALETICGIAAFDACHEIVEVGREFPAIKPCIVPIYCNSG